MLRGERRDLKLALRGSAQISLRSNVIVFNNHSDLLPVFIILLPFAAQLSITQPTLHRLKFSSSSLDFFFSVMSHFIVALNLNNLKWCGAFFLYSFLI